LANARAPRDISSGSWQAEEMAGLSRADDRDERAIGRNLRVSVKVRPAACV
jgi:hypothetical protein